MLMAIFLSNVVANVGHQVMKSRGPDMPMVVAGNKTDVDPALEREQTEALVRKPDQASKFNVCNQFTTLDNFHPKEKWL